MSNRLNRRGIFDPRFTSHFAFTAEKAMTATIAIYRPLPGATTHNFDTGSSGLGETALLLWTGPARMQPNKDWRARGYSFGNETTVFNAVRFQIPLVRGEWNPDVTERELFTEDFIVLGGAFFEEVDERMGNFVYTIRNPSGSSNMPLQNILTDADLKGGVSRGD